jgi:antitoxin MazE
MKAALVSIGNSRGIRIPKPIIEQCGFGETVELQVERNRLVITADTRPRQGWEEAFQAAGPAVGDELLLDALPNAFDRDEWKW